MTLPTCPICGATLADSDAVTAAHLSWHERTGTLAGWTVTDARERLRDAPAWMVGPTSAAGDDSPTQKFPPIGETVLRRPPPVPVRELRGHELLRALADELQRDEAAGIDPDREP